MLMMMEFDGVDVAGVVMKTEAEAGSILSGF